MAVSLKYKNVSQECEKNWRFLRYQFQKFTSEDSVEHL